MRDVTPHDVTPSDVTPMTPERLTSLKEIWLPRRPWSSEGSAVYAICELIREVERQRDEILQLAGEAMRTAKEVPISDDEIDHIADDVCRKGK